MEEGLVSATHVEHLGRLLDDRTGVIAELTTGQAELILELVVQERDRQHADTMNAIEDALGHLPRLLRMPAKKILLG